MKLIIIISIVFFTGCNSWRVDRSSHPYIEKNSRKKVLTELLKELEKDYPKGTVFYIKRNKSHYSEELIEAVRKLGYGVLERSLKDKKYPRIYYRNFKIESEDENTVVFELLVDEDKKYSLFADHKGSKIEQAFFNIYEVEYN